LKTRSPDASRTSRIWKEKKAVLLEFFEMLREEMPELPAIGKMKQLAGQFTKGLVGGAQFRQTLYHSHSARGNSRKYYRLF
jgi:tRNA-dihydrouridine synthase